MTRSRVLRSLAAFAALACATSCSGQTDSPPTPPVKLNVMTFNIRYPNKMDGPNFWEHRVEIVAKTILDAKPDIVGVQEAYRSQLDDLKPHLAEYAEIGVGREDGITRGEYSAILYKSAKLEKLEDGTFWYSDTPEVPGSMSWGNKITRICTWGRFRDKSTGRAFYVFNSHWDHESVPAREKSARMLAQRVADRKFQKEPIIVTGDFNTDEDTDPIKYLVGKTPGSPAVLRDVFRALHPDTTDTLTFNAWKGGEKGPRIDYILTEPNASAETCAIIRTAFEGRYPSDHYPVTATVSLP